MIFSALRFSTILLVAALCTSAVIAKPPGRSDLQLLADGVADFELGKSVPGVLSVDSECAIPLLTNENGQVFAAVGNATEGRVAAFGHGSFLKKGALDADPGIHRLMMNTIRWAGKAAKPSIGLAGNVRELEPLVAAEGMQVRVLDLDELTSGKVDVFCFIGQEKITAEQGDKLRRFVMKGGGVVVGATPWPFGDRFPDFATFPANQASNLAGIDFKSNGYASVKGTVSLSVVEPKVVLDAVAQLAKGGKETPDLETRLSELKSGTRLLGEDLVKFRNALNDLNLAIGPIVPTTKNQIEREKDVLIDTVMDLENQLNQTMPPEQLLAIPAANDYPGEVPGEAKRVAKALTIDGNFKGWLSGRGAGAWNAKEMRPTGLYAVAGEPIKVSLPKNLVGKGFEVVIGAYGGGLTGRKKWTRYSRLQRSFPLESETTAAANGFGGLVTIRVPQGGQFGPIEVKIEGAVEAPLYVHGETSVSEWNETIRNHPAPWAELASSRMILALPSEYIRELSDPDKVMEFWNAIIDKSAELAVTDRDLHRAERLVFDRQTAAGWMHSGYPVAAHEGNDAKLAVDSEGLKTKGSWGFFHEYGHNHQHNLWALPGTGETTCNLWSVYLYEELIGTPRDKTHGGVHPLKRRQRMNAYFENGRKFAEEWSVWTALESYLQVQEKFGWEPFQKVFDEYNKLPKDQWPKNQQQKNDQWVIRFSKACGVNLEPFYRAWNLPMSDFVAGEVAGLPKWEDDPVQRYLK